MTFFRLIEPKIKISHHYHISSHIKLLTREEHIHELAVGGPGAHLLYLGHLRVQAVIQPGQHLVSGLEY